MNKPTGQLPSVATPLKAWAQRFAFLFLVALAFALMLLGRSDNVLVERARIAVTDAVAPILDIAARPIETVTDTIEHAQALADLRAENAELKTQNQRLLQWQAVAQRLEAENQRLRQVANMVADPAINYVTARAIGDVGGTFVRSVLVAAGARDGVRKGQAAITGEGLAGRVAEVGERASRVLLISDMNSRIPVLVGSSRDRAVLGGDNTQLPRLLYLGPTAQVVPGDRVVTSGHGGAFPPGLPVGIVTEVGEAGVRVQPFVDWGHMELLRMVDYGLPGILDDLAPTGSASR